MVGKPTLKSPAARPVPSEDLSLSLVNARKRSQSLVNARQTLVRAHLRQQGRRYPENPKILQILTQTVRAPQITAHPPNPKNHSSDNRSQSLMISRATLVNARQTLVQAHLRQQGRRHPENPKILIQTVRAPQITAHPPNPKNHSSDNRSQSLMISRATLVNARQTLVQAHLRQQGRRHPENPKILIQTVRAPQITAHPPNPKNHSSDKRSQSLMISRATLVNARQTLVQAHLRQQGRRYPENPKILQILTQTVRAPQITAHPPNPKNHSSDKRSQSLMISRATLVNARQTLVQAHLRQQGSRHPENSKILQILIQTVRAPQITAHPPNPKNHSSDKRSQSLMISRATLVNARQTLVQAHLRQQGSRHPENSKILQILIQTVRAPQITAHPPKSQKSQFRQPLANAHDLSCNARERSSNARTSAPVSAGPQHPENPKKSGKSCSRQSTHLS